MAISKKRPSARAAKKMGRPPTDIEWKGIGVRFLPAEKERLSRLAPKFSLSQAEFIRRGTLDLMDKVERTGRLEITAGA